MGNFSLNGAMIGRLEISYTCIHMPCSWNAILEAQRLSVQTYFFQEESD